MNTDETRRLLSEYAAGKISEADRRELMRLASEDQAVFEAVLAEQPLAELMADPGARAELRAALTERSPRGFLERLLRPWPLAAAATAAVAVFAFFIGRYLPVSEKPLPSQVAELRPPAASQSGRGLSARVQEEHQADPPVKAKVMQAKSDSAAGPRDKDRSTKEVDLRVAANQAAAPRRTPAEAPGASPETADTGKEKKSTEPASAPPAESRVASVPPSDSRGRTVGGVAGGIVGGIAPPRQQATGRADTVSAVPAPREPRDEAVAGMAKAERPSASFQLLRRSADGTYVPVPPETVFHSGDAVQIELTLAASGYVQAAERLPSGGWRVLFPRTGNRQARPAAGSSLRVPDGGPLEIGAPPRDYRIEVYITAEPSLNWFEPAGSGVPPWTTAALEILIRASK